MGGDTPNYAGSDHFQGIRGSADGTIIDPALSKYTGDRLHAEYEVARNARLAYGERQRGPPVDGEDDMGVVPPPKGGPKGGAKRGAGRQGAEGGAGGGKA